MLAHRQPPAQTQTYSGAHLPRICGHHSRTGGVLTLSQQPHARPQAEPTGALGQDGQGGAQIGTVGSEVLDGD